MRRTALREDLRLLVMSATLDGARVATLLGDAPLIESEGRAYPVETRYVGRDPRARIEDEVAKTTLEALGAERGSILVFLPGQAEIMRTAALLEARVKDPRVDIAPLYGAMDRAAQDRAVAPARAGRRKVVLATSIAETSLTIEGVRIVIDSGLARVPRYEPDIGVTRLETQRVSKAGADQRRGRAGRTEPGLCYRLWEAAANGALAPFAQPEILSADLSGFLHRSRRLGRRRSRQVRVSSIRRRPPRSMRRARCCGRSARSMTRGASPRRARRSPDSPCRRDWRAWSSPPPAEARPISPVASRFC